MSAWIVDRAHIDVMVTALHPASQEHGDMLGRMLWNENLLSVAYRYPRDGDGDRPGPAHFRDSDVLEYTWTAREVPDLWVLAAAHCLDYQSCEHPGWEASEAKQICDRIVAELEPVYGDTWGGGGAPWGISPADLDALAAGTPHHSGWS